MRLASGVLHGGGAYRPLARIVERLIDIVAPSHGRVPVVAERHQGWTQRHVRRNLRDLLGHMPGICDPVLVEIRKSVERAIIELQCLRVAKRLTPDFGLLTADQFDVHGGNDFLGDIVLHNERVVDHAVVLFGPQNLTTRAVGQLRRHAKAFIIAAHRSLQHVLNAHLAADLLRCGITACIHRATRSRRDDEQPGDLD